MNGIFSHDGDVKFIELELVPRTRKAIMPLFLPFMGCGRHCVFCAQNLQTGMDKGVGELDFLLANCKKFLVERADHGKTPPELAFYGGTFTALPGEAWEKCLDYALQLGHLGLINGFRCSTRPDALPDRRLDELEQTGCQLIELGLQSFDDLVLQASGRGHDSSCSLNACSRVKKTKMALGIHLMPGLPFSSPEIFLADVRTSIAHGADCLRFHPCLVLTGTTLAKLWKMGRYEPWPLAKAIDATAAGWLLAARAGVPVIRMGLAPEPTLAQSILAGPQHPAFGSMTMGLALFMAVNEMREAIGSHATEYDGRHLSLHLPRWAQGCIWGWQGNLGPDWARIGINGSTVHFWDRTAIRLQTG